MSISHTPQQPEQFPRLEGDALRPRLATGTALTWMCHTFPLGIVQLKSSCRIEEVMCSCNVGLHPGRSNQQQLVGRCPFDKERHPTFTVYIQTQSFACSCCNSTGDVIGFVCRHEHLDIGEAVQRLRASPLLMALPPTAHDTDLGDFRVPQGVV